MKILYVAALFAAATLGMHAQKPVYLDDSRPTEERITDLMGRMTLEEKVSILHAQSKFSSHGVPRLGIPELWTSDGPHGVRAEVFWDKWQGAGWTNDSCTAFPALTCLAATWNPEISREYGRCVGEEARYRKKDVLLGPGVNIYRTPLNGRNFEYMGEDPYLASQMCVPYIQGVQSNGVAACVKHFALNNQEKNRHTTNVRLSERALHEIYLPAFKAAVEGGVWSVMGSYNLYKNQHCCHNDTLINKILKGDWAFDGAVVSDWGGTHDTPEAIDNGLDLEFGTWTDGLSSGSSNAYENYCLARPYLKMLKAGEADMKVLDDKVRRVLRLMYRTVLDKSRDFGYFRTPDHSELARKVAEEGIVLLKNNGNILPLKSVNNPRILVVGENAVKMMSFGGGSSSLKVKYEVSPLEGLKRHLGKDACVVFARGYIGNKDGLTREYADDPRTPEELRTEAVELAKDADYVIFVGGLNKAKHQDCEDRDREGLELPYGQDELISALAAANKNVIMVNISGNAVAMPWVKDVPAIVQAWYLGSESGNALASVLTGDASPSGKLPFSFPVSLSDSPAHASVATYPGTARGDGTKILDCDYNEDIFVGYRFYDKNKVKPLFPFGHGLSYTKFKYGKPSVDKKSITQNGTVNVSVAVSNCGGCAGAETVQLYISDPVSALPRPEKELKGFKKVYLQPGESKLITFSVSRPDLSYYDDAKGCWVCEPGKFEACIASSAADIRGKVAFEVTAFDPKETRYPKSRAEDLTGVMSEKYWNRWNDTEQARIDRDIDKYRKADAKIQLQDYMPGAEVKVEQVKHSFVFGAHIFNYNQLGSNDANERYRNLYGTLFNGATVPFYWKTFEPEPGKLRFSTAREDTEQYWNTCNEPYYKPNWRRPSTDQIVDFCKGKGIRMHGHVLVWGNRKWHHPEWMESYLKGEEKSLYNEMMVQRADLKNYKDGDIFNDKYNAMSPEEVYAVFPDFINKMNSEFDRRIRQVAERYGNTLQSWDVVNESTIDYEAGLIVPGNMFCKSKYGFMPGDYPYRALTAAAKAFPSDVALNINDYKMNQAYADEVKELLGRGAKIDIIGAQMHLFKPQNCSDIAAGAARQTPQQVRSWVEKLSANGIPIHLSEITITSPGDDEKGRAIQAVIARNLYRLWFSCEKMMGITWWNVVDDCGAPGEPNKSGLFDRQMNPKTAYYALADLINNEWRTNLTLLPENDGTVQFRGFKGTYKISYKARNGRIKTLEYELK